jgi:hypothetical protein
MIFRKKNGEAVLGQLEGELVAARAKRTALQEKLAGAEAALAQAISDRRASLLESDGDIGDSSDIIRKGTDRDALLDAIEVVEAKVAHLESRISQERSKAEREAAAAELTDRVGKVVAAVATLRIAGAAVCEVLPGLLNLTPHSNQQFGKDLSDLFVNVTGTIDEVLSRAKTQIMALRSPDGDARIMREAEPLPAPAPMPVVERTDCLLIADSTWPENGEVKSAGRWSIRGLPTDVASRAVELGWAFPTSAEVVQRLIETGQASINSGWHSPDPRTCIDLATVTRKPPRGSFGQSLGAPADADAPATLPAGAVETTGPGVTGTATAGPV